MSYSSDDENRPGECDWCHDDRGICDRFIELDEDRRFSIKLEETFDVHTVHNNDNSFFVIKHDFNYFNVYFSSFPIRLAYPMLCKTLCLGEDGFLRPWKFWNQKNYPKYRTWCGFSSKAVQCSECNPFWLQKLGSTLQDVSFLWRYACYHGSWWSWHRPRQYGHLGPCWHASNSTAMWVSQT